MEGDEFGLHPAVHGRSVMCAATVPTTVTGCDRDIVTEAFVLPLLSCQRHW